MKLQKTISLFGFLISLLCSTQSVNAQTDTVKYLFLGHPRYDDKNEYVIKKVEKLDYKRYDLLLLGGDLTWNTSALISTLDYCDQFFDLGSQNTHLAIGNHGVSNMTNLLTYTQKERYYSFNKNNITFIVLDTELATPNISDSQLDLIKNVADSIKNSHYLVIILHRILWMVDNPDLTHLQNSVGGSSSNLNSSNFFEEVYPEFQKIKNKGIPVFCIARDRTNVNIEYSIEDSIRFIASGMVDYLSDKNNYSIVLIYLPETKKLNYEFVPLSELDTISDETTVLGGLDNNARLDLNLFPNLVSD